MLEPADRADSNSAVRKDVWVRLPPAVPTISRPTCVAPSVRSSCVEDAGLGAEYAYLLGAYLGDGMLRAGPRGVWKLRIFQDAQYTAIIERTVRSIGEVSPHRAGQARRTGCVEIYRYWKHWICLFPQHGPGPKHRRRIVLAPWQAVIVGRYPGEVLAGLIESDGCRFLNRVGPYSYPRYMFSNKSADIRRLFGETCAALGIATRPAGTQNISVARRGSVAVLDQFVGPKR